MFYIHGYTLKTKYRNLVIFTNFSLIISRDGKLPKSLHFQVFNFFIPLFGEISQLSPA